MASNCLLMLLALSSSFLYVICALEKESIKESFEFPAGGSYQSWDDWFKKRNVRSSDWSFGDHSNKAGDYQSWQDWYKKRGNFHLGENRDFIAAPREAGFQAWKDWIKKRNMERQNQFYPHQFSGEPANFQSYNEWKKRMGSFSEPIGAPGLSANGAGFQMWRDFTKRSGLSGFGDESTMPAYQSWHEWMKRSMLPPSNFGPVLDGGKHRFMQWDQFAKRKLAQESNFPAFKSLFSNGFQSWGSAEPMKKREEDSENTEKSGN